MQESNFSKVIQGHILVLNRGLITAHVACFEMMQWLVMRQESDWLTVIHVSAVLQPDWSTEGKVYSFYQVSLRLRTQNKCDIGRKKTVKSDKALWRQITNHRY